MGPTSKAATNVPSRTPSIRPRQKNDVTEAIITRVTSKPTFTNPNSLFRKRDSMRTRYSPVTIDTLAFTSQLMPKPSRKAPMRSTNSRER